MRKNGRATISVVGHTDRSGDEKPNLALGQNRADAARQALVAALTKQAIGADKFGEIAMFTGNSNWPGKKQRLPATRCRFSKKKRKARTRNCSR